MANLQGKLEHAKMENRRLKFMYDQLRTDYNYMRMRFEKVMQDHKVKEIKGKEVFDGKFKEKKRTKNIGVVLGPRKFMNLGSATNKVNGKCEKKKRIENGELVQRQCKNLMLIINDETVMDHEASSSSIRKPRSKDQLGSEMKSMELVASKDEATMTKARVTIRARSEETMVISMLNSILTFNFATFYILFR